MANNKTLMERQGISMLIPDKKVEEKKREGWKPAQQPIKVTASKAPAKPAKK